MKNGLILALLLLTTAVSAQVEQGSVIIGGNLSLNTVYQGDIGNTTFNISPMAGFFVTNHLVVGGRFQIAFTTGDGPDGRTLGASPMIRYYFNRQSRVCVFGQGSFDWLSIKNENSDAQVGLGAGLGVGADFFINRYVALEGIIGFDSFKVEDAEPVRNIGFRVGVTAFIDQ